MSFTFRLNLAPALFSPAAKQAAQDAIRPATQAGADLVYKAARSNVRSSKRGHWFYGTSYRKTGQRYWFDPGTLQRAIYQAYSADRSSPALAVYHVSWNYRKAPYGHMVEFGTAQAKAQSFLRRAVAENEGLALEAMEARFWQELAQRGVL